MVPLFPFAKESNGAGISTFSASGEKQKVSTRVGTGVTSFVSAGLRVSGSEKIGAGSISFVSSAGKAISLERSGIAVFAVTANGMVESVYEKSGASIVISEVFGDADYEALRKGTAILFTFSEASASWSTDKPGAGVASFGSSGISEISEKMNIGTGILSLTVGGEVIDFVIIDGPTAVVSLRSGSEAFVRRASPE